MVETPSYSYLFINNICNFYEYQLIIYLQLTDSNYNGSDEESVSNYVPNKYQTTYQDMPDKIQMKFLRDIAFRKQIPVKYISYS